MQAAVTSDTTLIGTPLTCLLWKLLHHVLTRSLPIRQQSVTSLLCRSGLLIYSLILTKPLLPLSGEASLRGFGLGLPILTNSDLLQQIFSQ